MPHSSCSRIVVVAALLLLCGSARAVVLSREYSQTDARRSLQYANVTYADIDAIESWKCGGSCNANPSFKVTSIVKGDDAHSLLAYVGVDDGSAQVVVALRGSATQQEKLMRRPAEPVLYDITSGCGLECRVHTGFQRSYLAVRRTVRAAVVRDLTMHPGYNVLVTGHSVGAAVALLAAVDVQAHVNRMFFVSRPIVSLYTFGMPRVGNRAFAVWAAGMLSRGSHFRITSRHDPVPRMPSSGSAGFQHVPYEVYCAAAAGTNCRVCEDSADGDDPTCIVQASKVDMRDHFFYFGERISGGAAGDAMLYL
ncbi:lipase / LIP2 [Leishmania donovani]|uniref:Lipase (Class 3) family protein n=1 Tax=Leishmania donovani TaxID=5661 RepID=D7P7V3_LEIDO|nr:secretory lipase [Leishmania donovani]TPP41538.1 Lipase (class 3) family protein [Leishmania donovani]CAJ1991268.1 lipase / LIP2 [Leishmania donovani]VDZ47114.1 lipase_putative/GeneDB:LmjF.31.0830 [Leishmania donovani]